MEDELVILVLTASTCPATGSGIRDRASAELAKVCPGHFEEYTNGQPSQTSNQLHDGHLAAQMIQDALSIESDEVANYVFPETWPERSRAARSHHR